MQTLTVREAETQLQRDMVQRVLLRYHVSVLVFNPMSKEILLRKK